MPVDLLRLYEQVAILADIQNCYEIIFFHNNLYSRVYVYFNSWASTWPIPDQKVIRTNTIPWIEHN